MPVFLMGHGDWTLGDPPYAQVPRGTTITFYTENLKNLRMGYAAEMMALGEALSDAEPNQSEGEYKTVPNYTLSPLDEGTLTWFQNSVAADSSAVWVTQDTMLCTDTDGSLCGSGIHRCNGLFADENVVGNDLYWMACRHVSLEEVGGEALGANRAQAEPGYNEDSPAIGFAFRPDQLDQIWNDVQGLDPSQQTEWWNNMDQPQRDALLLDDRFAGLAANL